MKRFLSFAKKTRGFSPGRSDSGSTLSPGYEIKEKDLGKLHKAAFAGDLNKVKQLSKKSDVNQLDRKQRTPLHLACANGHAEVAQFLVENKAEVNLCDTRHQSPLMQAVQCQQESCVTVLLEHSADPNLVDINGNSALHLTTLIPSISVAELLLEHEADVNCQNKDGCTPLMLAVTENHIEMTEFLLEEGADMNIKDTMGRTSLMIAASNGQISMVRLLLRYEADVGVKDSSGLSAEDYAVRNGHRACSHLIAELGTKKKSPSSPFHLSSSERKSVPVLQPSENEDNSLEECLSGDSKNGRGDSWRSSDEEEVDFKAKKPQKINLRNLMTASQKHKKNAASEDAGQEDTWNKEEACSSKSLNDSREEDSSENTEDDEQSEEENEDDDEEVDEADEEEEEDSDESEEGEEEEEGSNDHCSVESVTSKVKLVELPTSIKKKELLESQVDCSDSDEENSKMNDARSTVDAEEQNKPEVPISFIAGISHDPYNTVEDYGKDEEGIDDEREERLDASTENQEKSVVFDKPSEGVPNIRSKVMMAGRMTVAPESEDEPRDSDVETTPGNYEHYAQSSKRSKQAVQELARKILQGGDPGGLSSNDELRRSRASDGSSDGQSCIDWGDERSDKEDSPQTTVDDFKCNQPLEEELQNIEENGVHVTPKSEATLTKAFANLKTELGASKQSPTAHEKDDGENMNDGGSKEEDADENEDHLVSAETISHTVSEDPTHKGLNKKRGLEVGGDHKEEESPWDSESDSDSPRNQQDLPVESLFKAQKVRQSISEGNRKGGTNKTCLDVGDPDDSSDWDSSISDSRNAMDYKNIVPVKEEPDAGALVPASPVRKPSPSLNPNIPKPHPRTRILKPVTAEDGGVKPCGSSHGERASSGEIDLEQEKNLPSSSESDKCKLHPVGIMKSETKGNPEDVKGSSVTSTFPEGHCDNTEAGKEGLDEDAAKCEEMRESGYSWYEDVEIRQVRAHYRSVTAELKEKFGHRVLPEESRERHRSQEEGAVARALDEESSDEEEGTKLETSGSRESVEPLREVKQECNHAIYDPHRIESSKNLQMDHCGEENELTRENSVGINQDNAEQDREISNVWEGKSKENSTVGKNNAYPISNQETTVVVSSGISCGDTQQNTKDPGLKRTQVLTPSRSSAAPSPLTHGDLEVDIQGSEPETEEEKKAEPVEFKISGRSKTKESGTPSSDVASEQENSPRASTPEPSARTCHLEPLQVPHVNRNPVFVVDHTAVTKMSQPFYRLPENPKFEQKTRDVEVADDFTQFTVDNMDPPGYEDSVVIKHLASCKGSMSTVKYQDALREYEWAIQKESAQSLHMLSKLSQLKVDRSKLGQIFKDMCDSRSALELQTLELKTELKNLKFILKQEQDKHSNTTMLYNKTCEQLNTMEAQYNAEIEKRQKVELIMSNLELEMKMLVSSMKQLEEDHKETQRMLAQESSARAFQEMLLNNHLQRQKESEEENRRTLKESKEVMSQLTKANDREKELLQENRNLQEQVTSLKMKLEWAHATRNQQGEGQQSEEIETLREKLEDTRRELKLNEEALAQTVLQYNGQVNALRAECAVATAKLEHEKQAREKLEVEAESARAQLVATLQDLERSRAMRADLERALQRERDDSKREQEKHTCEEASQRESIHSLTQQLSVAEGRVRNLEQELHQSKLSLAEKSLLLERVQLEYSQAQARLVELESTLKAEREQGQRATAQHEIVKKQLAQVQEEVPFLCQRLEESQNVHDHFSELLAKLRNGCEERVTVAEDKSKEMIAQNAKLQEELKRQEKETKEQETAVRRLRQELADMLKKLTVCEASIEVNQQHRTDLKEQNQRLQRDNERLKEKLQDSERRCIEAERLTKDGKEHNAITTSQKLQDVMSPPAGTDKATKQLEEAVRQLESENNRLESITKQQTHRIEGLLKGAQEAAAVRSRLEDLITNLQGNKMNLEDQLSRELLKKKMLSQNVEENRQVWEEELKSRSKMSLWLATLEKEKRELSTQVEAEKKKVKRISEQKTTVDIRLDQEIKRNSDLHKEMYRLKTLVKITKKKLREQEKAEFALHSKGLPVKTDQRLSGLKSKLEELSVQLDEETGKCKRLERVNEDLKEKLSNYKDLVKRHKQLERYKSQLEDKVASLQRQMKSEMMDRSQAEQYRREIVEQAQKEVRQKLEEVNLFLQNQAASHDALEQMKAANEASLRTQMEQRLQELEKELSALRSSHQDALSQRHSMQAELERFRELYAEELRLRKGLAAKLERSNERLTEAHTRLLTERQHSMSLISSGIANGSLSRPDLEVGAFGAMLGHPNKKMALESSGGSILGPGGDMQGSKVETYLAQMQNDLEKKISKELAHVMVEQDGSPCMSSGGSGTGSQKSPAGDQDAINRATQQYLEVLKKNYLL